MSIYRKSIWVLKGLREYTKNGYLSAEKNFKAGDLDVDLKGRSFMITGANSGLGLSTATAIAERGGTVHMVCRSQVRGEEAQKEIQNNTGNQDVHLHILDMCRPRDVASFARDFSQSGSVLNVLVNNAGCMVNEREVDEDGLEKNFATNTLGTHILTRGLIPMLLKAENPRVIIVSSGGMLTMKLDPVDLQFEQMRKFDGTMAYAQNKRQQVVMAEHYAKEFPQIHFSSMHPGWADTPAVRMSMPDFYEKMKNKLRTAAQGADTLIWLAIAKSVTEQQSGLFYQDRTPVAAHLPLAWSRSTPAEETLLMDKLNEFMTKFGG